MKDLTAKWNDNFKMDAKELGCGGFSLDRIVPVTDSSERHNELFVSTGGEEIVLKSRLTVAF